MTTCIGPKVKFELLQNKKAQFPYTHDYEYQDSMQQLVEKRVSFADSSIVFLHYSEEEIFNFRQSQYVYFIQQEQIRPVFLNPSLYDSSLQNKTRSCFKPVEF